MWLLNARTKKLEEYHEGSSPPYAILSHRWEEEEVSFEAIAQNPSDLKGYRKIDLCCKEALQCHEKSKSFTGWSLVVDYVWVDTCCIDKRSSAELSEAINSMYTWYSNAAVCFAYLGDVDKEHPFEHSAWFTRGWTLQELLAPRIVLFFNSNWEVIGTKKQLQIQIERRCCIPRLAICNFDPSSDDYCIAEKMRWASTRLTSRTEDSAYSLLGIFAVNLPLLYGEGRRAFVRLQEELMRTSNDMSLFLWTGEAAAQFGLLAASVLSFRDTDLERRMELQQNDRELAPIKKQSLYEDGYTYNNAGVLAQCYLAPYLPSLYIAYLQDWRTIKPFNWTPIRFEIPVIFLRRTSTMLSKRHFQRVRLDRSTWHTVTILESLAPHVSCARLCQILIVRKPESIFQRPGRTSFHVHCTKSFVEHVSGIASWPYPSHSEQVPGSEDYFTTEELTWHESSKESYSAFDFEMRSGTSYAFGVVGSLSLTFNNVSSLNILFAYDFYFRPLIIVQDHTESDQTLGEMRTYQSSEDIMLELAPLLEVADEHYGISGEPDSKHGFAYYRGYESNSTNDYQTHKFAHHGLDTKVKFLKPFKYRVSINILSREEVLKAREAVERDI